MKLPFFKNKKQQEDQKQAIARTKAQAEYDMWKQLQKDVTNLLEPVIQEWMKQAQEELPCHFQAGDTVVLNKYGVPYTSSNSWDCGSLGLLSCLSEDKKRYPFDIQITEIRVHRAFLDSVIEDRWLPNLKTRDLAIYAKDVSKCSEALVDYLTKSINLPFPHKCGLYLEAFFTTNVGFNPRWGLNVYSFLLKTSQTGQKTWELWQRMGDADQGILDGNNAKIQVQKEINKMQYTLK